MRWSTRRETHLRVIGPGDIDGESRSRSLTETRLIRAPNRLMYRVEDSAAPCVSFVGKLALAVLTLSLDLFRIGPPARLFS